jgi:hypothetical protein
MPRPSVFSVASVKAEGRPDFAVQIIPAHPTAKPTQIHTALSPKPQNLFNFFDMAVELSRYPIG